MTKQFPQDYTRLSPVTGTEKVMAARLSDGEMFYISLSDITSGFVKANGGTLTGTTLTNSIFSGSVTGLTKTMVGLGNVDNTPDTAKPISTATATALAAKVSLVNGVVPAENLPPVVFQGVTGTGTAEDPYKISGLDAQLRALPGFEEGMEKILYGGVTFRWGSIPAGGNGSEKLATPVIAFGSATSASIPLSWAAVPNAEGYLLQRDTVSGFTSAITVYAGNAHSFTDTALTAGTVYYYRLKANADGFTASDYGTGSNATVSASGETLISVDSWITPMLNFEFSGNNLIGHDYNDGVGAIRSKYYIPSTGDGSVQWTGDAAIMLDDQPLELAFNRNTLFVLNRNSANSKLDPRVNGEGTGDFDTPVIASGSLLRIRVTGTSVYFEYQLVPGTWLVYGNYPRPAGIDLYIKGENGYEMTDSATNISGTGILLNASLPDNNE